MVRLRGEVKAHHAEQESLDTQALRLDADCLKAEDYLDAVKAEQQQKTDQFEAEKTAGDQKCELEQKWMSLSKELHSELQHVWAQVSLILFSPLSEDLFPDACSFLSMQLETASLEVASLGNKERQSEAEMLLAARELSAAQDEVASAYSAVHSARLRYEEAASAAAGRDSTLAAANIEVDVASANFQSLEAKANAVKAQAEAERATGIVLKRLVADSERSIAALEQEEKATEAEVKIYSEQRMVAGASMRKLQADLRRLAGAGGRERRAALQAARDVQSSLHRQAQLVTALEQISGEAVAGNAKFSSLQALVAAEQARLSKLQSDTKALQGAYAAALTGLDRAKKSCNALQSKLCAAVAEKEAAQAKHTAVRNSMRHHEVSRTC